MKKYDFTVVGTAATVSVLHVDQMPECGKSTPVMDGDLFSYSNGGMGFNICAGLAKLGASVYPVLTYADDRQRSFLHQFVQSYHMPEDGLCDPPEGARGTTLMIQDRNKNHMTLITDYKNRLATSTYYGKQVMHPHFFNDSRMIVLTAPMAMNTENAIRAIRQSGVDMVLSMRKDPNAWPHDLLRQALEISHIVFANESEVSFLVKEYGLHDICDLFNNGKTKLIVETLGENGSRIYSLEKNGIEVTKVNAISPRTKEIDTVGAGDGYVSGFLYGYIHGKSIAECAGWGSAVSSFVLEAEGSVTNLPTAEQMIARYEESKSMECEKE